MELAPTLDLKLLENQQQQEQTILGTANIFFFLLKIPKILLQMT